MTRWHLEQCVPWRYQIMRAGTWQVVENSNHFLGLIGIPQYTAQVRQVPRTSKTFVWRLKELTDQGCQTRNNLLRFRRLLFSSLLFSLTLDPSSVGSYDIRNTRRVRVIIPVFCFLPLALAPAVQTQNQAVGAKSHN